MLHAYRIESAQLAECDPAAATVLAYSQLAESEKEEIKRVFDLDPFDLESVSDPDEVSRLETTPDSAFLVWKSPDNVTRGDTIQFKVSSLGIAIRGGKAALIHPGEDFALSGREFKHVASVWEAILRVFLSTIHHYQGHLKAIKMMSQDLQAKLEKSMENKYFLQMFALGESLVYYLNALESNGGVLAKLRAAAERQHLAAEEIELLDDILIENQQAIKQASIYSSVLSGLMDARGNIINNNMNVLLKNLTLINVVFLPLNLIASIGGMSEFSMMTQHLDWRVAYALFGVGMAILGVFTWWWLVKVLERNRERKPRRGATA